MTDRHLARAIVRYGVDTIRKAYDLNTRQGEGALVVAIECDLRDKHGRYSAHKAHAAINAGRALAKREARYA